MTRTGWLLLPLLLAACDGGRGERDVAVDTVEAATAPDSMVLSVDDSTSVWLAEAREATDSTGATCLERVIEIRRDTVNRRVPLLYTAEAPVLLDDTTLSAVLYRDCRPTLTYRVDLRTGYPTRKVQ